MTERTYKASLSQSQGREGWSVIFRHPVLPDRATGKPGRRVRRGLGTKDQAVANELIAQLNELLSNRIYWDPGSRPVAARVFNPTVVDIFYYDMVPDRSDAYSLREGVIPLPSSRDSKYRRVLLLGPTGGGKTTLVRQLIGTDPMSERFPATSAGKTTVADTEIVLAPGPFRAAVTFLPRDQVRDYIDECMSAAAFAAYQGRTDTEMRRRLLDHADQRFRLSYMLGTGEKYPWGEGEEGEEYPELPRQMIDSGNDYTHVVLDLATQRLRTLAAAHGPKAREEAEAEETDTTVRQEMFEDAFDRLLREDERFQELGDEFMEEIESLFVVFSEGTLEKTKQGWPKLWSFESEDREAFLDRLGYFSSNYAPRFGILLTPLVRGIRVAGPLVPKWTEQPPALVLFDVEGLGHTPDQSLSLPASIVRRLNEVDAVLLVDSATQPMQASSLAALRTLASNGQTTKLIICFTHFDGVVGDNIPTFRSKEHHVRCSAENALNLIGEQLGAFAERALRQRVESACFFFGDLHRTLRPDTPLEKRTIAQLQGLLQAIDASVVKPEPVLSRPVYDRLNLALAARQAAEDFHAAWDSKLGIRAQSHLKEDWQRIRALCRRMAEGWDDEYLSLKPLADLHRQLQESVFRFITSPASWDGAEPSEAEKERIFSSFAQDISQRLLALVTIRMIEQAIPEWRRAYYQSGKGSTFARATSIAADIYDKAAPIPESSPTREGNKFLQDVMGAVRAAAEQHQITLR